MKTHYKAEKAENECENEKSAKATKKAEKAVDKSWTKAPYGKLGPHFVAQKK